MHRRPRTLLGAILVLLLGAVAAAPAQARNVTVRSFDGTKIAAHFFPTAKRVHGKAPTVLVQPNWSQPAARNRRQGTSSVSGVVGIGTLLKAGYNVLTWDSRGFYKSGGTVSFAYKAREGRDVKALVSYVARQREAKLDHRRDPRVGMVGASYGGGIQLVAASLDKRIDALVPSLAWHSLRTSLYKAGTVKAGWLSLFYATGSQVGRLDAHIRRAYNSGQGGGRLSESDLGWFTRRGPGSLVGRVRAPTLFIQGTVDTLFTLDEAVTNYATLRRHGVPTKMLWFCGGHGVCLTKRGRTSRIKTDTLHWLSRYLKRNRRTKTGPRFEWLDQNGVSASARDYPLRHLKPRVARRSSATLPLAQGGGAGPAGTDLNAVLAITPAFAQNAVSVKIRGSKVSRSILGAPVLSMVYRSSGVPARRVDGRVQAQLVDDRTKKVLGNQITPIKVRLDGKRHKVKTKLEVIAATLTPGRSRAPSPTHRSAQPARSSSRG
jgi:ABC-2 type transport system ATP-binding protein